jgi:hypothetical protein
MPDIGGFRTLTFSAKTANDQLRTLNQSAKPICSTVREAYPMKVHEKWKLGIAALALLPALTGMLDLYESRDLWKDWAGPVWVFICLTSLYEAFRKPRVATVKQRRY